MNSKRAFTILEISIVILIASMTIIIVTAGKIMINQANIRSIISEFGEINKAISGMILQYNALPGDMRTATYLNSNITANGNGNNIIESDSSGCGSTESIIAWNHLYYTDNYPIKLSGVSGTPPNCILPGVNVPNSKVTGGIYFLWNAAGNTVPMFGISSGNIIHFGSVSSSGNSVNGSILSASEAASLDKKIDDGIANTGILLGIDGNEVTSGTCSGPWAGAGANYQYNNLTVGCRMVYLLEK